MRAQVLPSLGFQDEDVTLMKAFNLMLYYLQDFTKETG
jgi:hypothetical protein